MSYHKLPTDIHSEEMLELLWNDGIVYNKSKVWDDVEFFKDTSSSVRRIPLDFARHLKTIYAENSDTVYVQIDEEAQLGVMWRAGSWRASNQFKHKNNKKWELIDIKHASERARAERVRKIADNFSAHKKISMLETIDNLMKGSRSNEAEFKMLVEKFEADYGAKDVYVPPTDEELKHQPEHERTEPSTGTITPRPKSKPHEIQFEVVSAYHKKDRDTGE